MADIDVLNKLKHKNNNTKWKYGIFKVKFSIYHLEDLNFAFILGLKKIEQINWIA